MLYDNRANVLATLVVLGLVLAAALSLPTWSREIMVLGSPLTISVTQTTMMALLLTGIVCAGTDTVVRLHPRARKIDGSFSFVTWTVPALTTALAAVLLPELPSLAYRAAGYVVTGLLLVLLISAEYVTIDPADRRYPAARFLLSAWAYLLALVAFVLIYSLRSRSLVSATAVTMAGALLALDLLRGAGQGFGRTALYALIAGLSTGQVIWAMNYMRLGGVSGGLVLLFVFYIATGVANQTLQAKLTRRLLLEYGAVAVAGLIVLLIWGT